MLQKTLHEMFVDYYCALSKRRNKLRDFFDEKNVSISMNLRNAIHTPYIFTEQHWFLLVVLLFSLNAVLPFN